MTGGGVCAEAAGVLCTAELGSSTAAGVVYDPPASPPPSALVPWVGLRLGVGVGVRVGVR